MAASSYLPLLGGILKALFTTRPTETTEVIVRDDGKVEVKPAKEKELAGSGAHSSRGA